MRLVKNKVLILDDSDDDDSVGYFPVVKTEREKRIPHYNEEEFLGDEAVGMISRRRPVPSACLEQRLGHEWCGRTLY